MILILLNTVGEIMQVRNHGKYTKMSKTSPRAIARCDYSGLMVSHSDLVKQMAYRGSGLVWTGYYVYNKFVDIPNAQNLAPRVKLDPIPVADSRPDNQVLAQNTTSTSVGILTLDVSGNADITLTTEQFNNGEFNFTGVLLGDIVIYVPNTYNQFYANNLTTGGFTLGMQIMGNASSPLIIPAAEPTTLRGPTVVNTFNNLQFVYF